MPLKYDWKKRVISTAEEAQSVFKTLREQKPIYFAFDTETTGLNIGKDKPFFFQFGWLDTESIQEGLPKAYSYAVDLEEDYKLATRVIKSWHSYILQRKEEDDRVLYVGQNIKYDMHMLANVDLLFDEKTPITELQFWIRYAHDSLQIKEGGPPMSLKAYASKYILRSAKNFEQELSKQRTHMASEYNNDFRRMLIQEECEVPDMLKDKYKSMTLSCVKDMFKDPIFSDIDLPEDVYIVYQDWKNELPVWLRNKVTSLVHPDDIPYNKLSRTVLGIYALDDIVWTLEIFAQCHEMAVYRKNTEAIYNVENPSLWAIWRMERTGFKIDKVYLEEARVRLREYILEKREELRDLTGKNFKIGQSQFIKDMLYDSFDLEVESTGAGVFKVLISDLKKNKQNPEGVDCMERIQELRTLEKWYSTYIMRFKVSLDFYNTDRIWAQINSVGAVTGRFSSSMQQMPKEGLKYIRDGKEIDLFNPRKMVIVPEEFAGMSIIDYAAEELRFQAMYTILCGDADLNLCRAFMPYKCSKRDGTSFDYNNKEHLKEYNSGEWFLDEDHAKEWTPIDLHSEMTVNCGFDRNDPDFKHHRKIGKILNFMKNYGGGLGRIREMFPQFSLERCKVLDGAYYKTFPGVKTYHKYCSTLCATSEYATNLFGTKYYGLNAHKCKNVLVQGSCASYLKIKLKELDDFIQNNNLKSVLLGSVHDEIDFYIAPGEEHCVEDFTRIMTTWDDALVPIVAEPDYGTTNWADVNGCSYYDWKEKNV